MIYFLLCAYNESKNITNVISNIRSLCNDINEVYKIIIVDDGSTDDTLQQVEKVANKDIVVLVHDKNLGLGVALKTGFSYLFNVITDNDVIITMDADNTHPVETVKLMLREYKRGSDIVIASRYSPGGGQLSVPLYRRLISFIARCVLKILFPYKGVRDYTSGYRLYSGKIVKNLTKYYGHNFVMQKDFSIQLEILLKLFKFLPVISEVPLKIEYYKKCGKSKLKIVKNIISYIKMIVSFKLSKKLVWNKNMS